MRVETQIGEFMHSAQAIRGRGETAAFHADKEWRGEEETTWRGAKTHESRVELHTSDEWEWGG